MITGDFVDKIHRLEQKIFAWNVNELHDMIRFVGLGVDGFFSDKPDLALKNDSWKSVKQF
ncbi:MAG: hypothetical protein HY542_03995 [Deltaproteobacteria bacterium]|nr:hypothetical protein [Deltaproteobacteria bacterium]